jgi:hypothetical protein
MKKARTFSLPLVFLLTIFVTTAAFAKSEGPEIVGRMVSAASGVSWQTNVEHEKIVLTVVTPDGRSLTKEFAAGTMPSFRLQDLAGKLADGAYRYELRVVPSISAGVKAQLAAAREANDDATAQRIMHSNGLDRETTQSGTLTVINGTFVNSDAVEPTAKGPRVATTNATSSGTTHNPTALDIVQPDDVIIQGSLCVGLDCVVNESFGFDTIRLKENNTRIKFQDTSTASGFPNHSWQLTANDSASGGANKFSIEDITAATVPVTITGSSPSNSIFVDSTGRVGLRTSTPVLDLHLTTGNTPSHRFEQNTSGGFSAQTWDVAGNEANFFVRDITGGSRLPFRIRPGAPTSSIDISASGNVGIGTASPQRALDVQTALASGVTARMQNKAASGFEGIEYLDELGNVDLFIGEDNAGNQARYNSMNSNPHVFLINGAERSRIDNTGLTVTGNLTVTGVKNFAMPDPADSKKALYYTALEGPEAGTYFRGTAKTVNGEAVIVLPGYFARITEKDRMTVQLTPVGAPGQLYIAEKTPERVVIKVAKDGGDLEFDYLVQGIRKGYLDYAVERENKLP